MNTERVALQRRLVEDDQWVVPHNICLAMYPPASVNVLPFDPERGRAARALDVEQQIVCCWVGE